MEMREAAHVLHACTPRSLVLIDELGRGTSADEGRAIAWAVCEALLQQPAYTLFVTHYEQLCTLAEAHPNARNISLCGADSAGKTLLLSLITTYSAHYEVYENAAVLVRDAAY
jgi:DNA mismatch repair protein MutS